MSIEFKVFISEGNMKIILIFWALLLSLSFVGCEGEVVSHQGEEGYSCKDDNTCNKGLDCVKAKCENHQGEEGYSCKNDNTCNEGLDCINIKCKKIIKLWAKEWGTDTSDKGNSIAVDALGNIFVTGYTYSGLDGNTNIGYADIFLTKFDSDGNKLWTKQWGSSRYDEGRSVAVDVQGNIFVTGYTDGSLDGNVTSGDNDVFLTKLDNDGNKLWTKQWGTDRFDRGYSIALDIHDNVLITGVMGVRGGYEVFLTKFDNNGNKLWIKQWNVNGRDEGHSVTIDHHGNFFVTGHTQMHLEGTVNGVTINVFLTKLDSSGNKLWTKEWGVSINDSKGAGIAIDTQDNIFVTGIVDGNLEGNTNIGEDDIFLTKLDGDGNKLWTKQWGTSDDDGATSVVIDAHGNVLVTGMTKGSLDGNTSTGGDDIFLTKFDSDGNKLWTKQWGTSDDDGATSVVIDAHSNIFVTGLIKGTTNDHGRLELFNVFLTKFGSK